MIYKIAIFGSNASADEKRDELPESLVKEFGVIFGKISAVIITGACSGIPYQVAFQASKNNCEIWGYSPEIDFKHQKEFTPRDDLSIYTKLIYTPQSFPLAENSKARKKYRNVLSTAECDAGIIISGRWGTMNEFTNLFDMGKVIGVLTGVGGIADELPRLMKKIHKKSKAKIFFSHSPKILIDMLMKELKLRYL